MDFQILSNNKIKMEPKLIIKCTQFDFELTELLGEKSTDFIVLLADVQSLQKSPNTNQKNI